MSVQIPAPRGTRRGLRGRSFGPGSLKFLHWVCRYEDVPSTRTRTVAPRRLTLLAAAAALALVVTACMIPEEETAFNSMNRERAALGVPNLSANGAAITKAQNWATHLALNSGGICHSSKLQHSNLADGAPAGWRALAENVGCVSGTGPWQNAIPALHAQFMNSPGHRANIVNRTYNYGGVGLSMISTGANSWVVYETQFFVQL